MVLYQIVPPRNIEKSSHIVVLPCLHGRRNGGKHGKVGEGEGIIDKVDLKFMLVFDN
jgi:hypothetical protein